jgi:hypothetical protein
MLPSEGIEYIHGERRQSFWPRDCGLFHQTDCSLPCRNYSEAEQWYTGIVKENFKATAWGLKSKSSARNWRCGAVDIDLKNDLHCSILQSQALREPWRFWIGNINEFLKIPGGENLWVN